MTFSESVTVSGDPRMKLDVGERKRWARYSGGSDSATLTFAYKVKKNDRDDNGVSIRKNAVALNGGTIQDGGGNAARLKHPALADQAGHKVNGSPADLPPIKEPDPVLPPAPTPTPEPQPQSTTPAPPSALSLEDPATSPGNDASPLIRVTVGESGGTVTLYSDSACATPASPPTTVSDSTAPYTVDVTANTLSGEGDYSFYARHAKGGRTSSCSTTKVDYTLDTTAPTYDIDFIESKDQFTGRRTTLRSPATGNSGVFVVSTYLKFSEAINQSGLTINYRFGSGSQQTFTYDSDRSLGSRECALATSLGLGSLYPNTYICTLRPGTGDQGLVQVKVSAYKDQADNAGAPGAWNTWGFTANGVPLPPPTIALKSTSNNPDASNPGEDPKAQFTVTVPQTGARVAFHTLPTLCTHWSYREFKSVTDTDPPYTVDFTAPSGLSKGAVQTYYFRYIDDENLASECGQFTYHYDDTPRLKYFRALPGHGNVGLSWWLPPSRSAYISCRSRSYPETGCPTKGKWQYRVNPGGLGGEWQDAALMSMHPARGHVIGFRQVGALADGTLLANDQPYTVQARVFDIANNTVGWLSEAVTVTPRAYTAPAAQTVPADWPLIPRKNGHALVQPGEKFRLMFVTAERTPDGALDKIHALPRDVGHYNHIVQTSAARNDRLVNSDGNHFGGEFRALISTSATDARDNTATTGRGVPIYFLGGEKTVADDYADFYDGSWNEPYRSRDEMGRQLGRGLIWTGSKQDGTRDPSNYAGEPNGHVRYASVLSGGTLTTGATNIERLNHLFALSPVLTVASD